ncbi:LysR family transcriptional regulator ArgP [Arthrobacter cryoconiti]|uniref:LysR family transcriptional regulator ArgP n=1 Tax=Arthrobacter cryoconiti TaxID=748907 RepID=A0ABV8QWS6_9MICC|nr:LysR family transcriptional regulator ArgP [Arthrobacter cryoconiti]MCC9067305.1 LysR family transcriptional regulator ArgP [Arthrobacter cryoconiti]
MSSFQTDQLRTFLAVLEHGTFDAAAKELCVSASAVSQRIKAMEQAAGQVLLVRATPVRSTAAGMAVQKLARQLRQLESDCAAELGLGGKPGAAIAMAVNADSLATWFIDALGAVPASERHSFEVLREDEQHSAALLRSGEVMAAVTATSDPVQGCSVRYLGALEYKAVASAEFMTRFFPAGFDSSLLSAAPVVQFDRTDTLQSNFFKALTNGSLTGSQRFIPDPSTFAVAIEHGLGWGLLPEANCREGLGSGKLVELVPGLTTRIPLYWQRWKIQSPALDALTAAVTTTAAAALS